MTAILDQPFERDERLDDPPLLRPELLLLLLPPPERDPPLLLLPPLRLDELRPERERLEPPPLFPELALMRFELSLRERLELDRSESELRELSFMMTLPRQWRTFLRLTADVFGFCAVDDGHALRLQPRCLAAPIMNVLSEFAGRARSAAEGREAACRAFLRSDPR
jgi:hypothetical protein